MIEVYINFYIRLNLNLKLLNLQKSNVLPALKLGQKKGPRVLTHDGHLEVGPGRVAALVPGDARVARGVLVPLHVLDDEGAVLEHPLPVVDGQLPALALPHNVGDGVAGHRAGHEHGLAGHDLHVLHGPDEGGAVDLEPRRVADRPDLGRGHAPVQAAVLGPGLGDVEVGHDLAVGRLEAPDADAGAEVVADLVVVQVPGDLGGGVALGDAGHLDRGARLQGALLKHPDELGRVEAAAELELGRGLGALLVVSDKALVHAAVLLLDGLDPQHALGPAHRPAVLEPEDIPDRVAADVALERGRPAEVDHLLLGLDVDGEGGWKREKK